MTDVLSYVKNRWNLDTSRPVVEIPNFGRDGLAEMFANLGFHSGAEIGVQNGDYSEVLCKANPKAKIFSIDGWRHYKGYHYVATKAQQDINYANAVARLSVYKIFNIDWFIDKFWPVPSWPEDWRAHKNDGQGL